MTTLAPFNPEIERELDEPGSPFHGLRANHHESAASGYPGDVRLDDEENDVNFKADRHFEMQRLRRFAPGATVRIGRMTDSMETDDLGLWDSDRWEVSIRKGDGVFGLCLMDVSKGSLRDACDAAFSNYRAKLLDAVVSVPAVAGVGEAA